MNLYGYTDDLCPSDQTMARAVLPLGINFIGFIFYGILLWSIKFLLVNSSTHKAHLHYSLNSLGSNVFSS
jgi:hypothetical protein